MIAVPPKVLHVGARRVVFAKHQPEYGPLPASLDRDGVVMTEWEFTAEELALVLEGGRVRLWIFTNGEQLQPVQLEVANG